MFAGLDTQVDCAQSGTPDHINRIQCQQTYYDVSCQVDGIDVTKGFSANPLIPIPYYQNKQTLEVDFPDNRPSLPKRERPYGHIPAIQWKLLLERQRLVILTYLLTTPV